MCNRTEEIPVLALSDLSTNNSGFVMLPLKGLHQRYHFLEQAHQQAYYTILFCQKGKGTIMVDKQNIALRDNCVICIGPNSVSSLDTKDISDGQVIFFSGSFFSMRYNENILYDLDRLKYDNVCRQVLDPEDAEEWCFYMKLMEREYLSNTRDAIGILSSYMNIILSILNRNNSAPTGQQAEVRSIKAKKIISFEQLIEAHFKTEKLPSFYANSLFISVNYLNRICQEKRGSSSGDMIRRRVIIEAERLLFHTYNTVSEIALELGFESASYFTTFFKKHTGCTPDAFRKMNK